MHGNAWLSIPAVQPLYGGCLGYPYAAGTRALHAMHGPQELFIENKHMECMQYLGDAGNKGIVKKKSAGGETSGQSAVGGGEALHALYDYRASPDIPFPPDPRPELSMQRGDVFHLKYKRSEDGWCLVSIASHLQHQQDASDVGVEGWIPGNFVSKDGKTPFVESRVKSGILLKYRDV